ncbi:uncharacterized protein LOC130664915 isoform X2 [Microplitis mediator]|uniref:uncharacterized protein LOC130664915 isoform X2 n=1 Tax=Microplitis mediator TaxID=375433 RepID=UPI002554380A|nr:uncharacterized protein LOC130664915 isoform X2 [Microplitis mediator]
MHYKILFIFILKYFINLSFATISTHVKWDKSQGDFIPINNTSVDQFESPFRKRSHQLEVHKFQGELIKLAYYEEKNLIDFYDKDSKVTGICGEIWNILSEYLNFTAHMYNRPEYKSNESWIFRLFSWRVWLLLATMLIIFSVLGSLSEKILPAQTQKDYLRLQDYFFYTFATFCSQGWLPQALEEKCKILELSKRIFSWFLLITISTHLVSHMTNTAMVPPFSNFESLLNSTNYQILVHNGSLSFARIKMEAEVHGKQYLSRFHFVASKERMTHRACWSKKKYAIVEADDRQQASGMKNCYLVKTGEPLFSTWTTNGIVKGFKYKRSFDIGIIRLHECGLLDGLIDRWMPSKITQLNDYVGYSINFDHVFILFVIMFFAGIVSIFICVVENIVFLHNRYLNEKKKLIIQKKRRQQRIHAKRFLFITKTQLKTLKASAKTRHFFK